MKATKKYFQVILFVFLIIYKMKLVIFFNINFKVLLEVKGLKYN